MIGIDAVVLAVTALVALAVGALLAVWAVRGRADAARAEGARARDAEVAALEAERRALDERLRDADARLQDAVQQERTLTAQFARAQAEHAALLVRQEQAARAVGELAALQTQHRAQGEALALAERRVARLEAELVAAQAQAAERLALLDKAEERLRASFQALAGEILEDKAKRFGEQSQGQLDLLLGPLREQLREFRQTLGDTFAKEQRERGMLAQEIATLKALNERISQDAINLTRALKGDSKTQGSWGELVLERVLEASGLQRGREYEVQSALHDEDGGRPRPDVIVHLPDGKDLVLDAKVSLTAYERAQAAVDDGEREREATAHVASLRRHIQQLADRNYAALAGVRTLDFVILFVPVEGAFIEAVRRDEGLYAYALSRNIALTSPSTLLATLRTVSHLWRIADRNANAAEIAKKAGAMYDRFVALVEDLQALGQLLARAQSGHETLMKRLANGKGNLLRRADELRRLGADASKALPEALLAAAEDETPPSVPAAGHGATGDEDPPSPT